MAKLSYYRNKADKLYQEIGRHRYKYCLVCGGEYSCLHHFIPKGRSSALRYDLDNGIPICNSCHFKIHKAQDPTPTVTILAIKGEKWFNKLKKKQHNIIKINKSYYQKKINELQKILRKEIANSD
jgi:5-methylcytosine-specific restriction endonuclease McrA